MAWGKSVLLTIPLVLSGIFVVASPASAQEFSDTDWKSISAGGSHACGTDNSGYLYCWGNDDSGQLGNTEALNSKTDPDRVGDSTGWTVVSAGRSHTCGIRSGKLYCWGSDSHGQLGNGADADVKPKPVQITTAADWKTVSAGESHTCATRGKLYCWGSDLSGQLGNGASGSTTVPAQITTATDWKTVSAGASHTCATRGKLYCWGSDLSGQLGNGTTGSRTSPMQITTATDWKTVSAGASHTCATRGKLYCWGNDSRGQLGNSASGSTTVLAQITTAADWKTVSAGESHTCAIRGTSNALYCWGDNTYGQTVASSEDVLFSSPQLYPGGWKAQDTGQRHTCAIRGDGTLNCWGVPEPPPPDDCPAPGTNAYANDPWQNLGYWKLTTPIDANKDGKADEVKQPTLKSLDGKDYFDRLSTPTRIMFRARVDGATTSGSSFPRSELREMTQDGQYNRAAWSSQCGRHTMTIEQAITAQPDRGDDDPVVAGQIHDGGVDGGHGDVIMIRLEGTRLFVEGDGVDHGTLDASYTREEKFTVVVTADSSGIDVSYDNATGTTATLSNLQPKVNNKQWYFKAGCYTQANASNGTGYGEVVVYDLAVEHL